MFMASRYLATVRRATLMPRRFSSSARPWSDSGLPVGSASMSLRIMAWIAVADALPPSTVDTPLEECASRDPKGLYRKARAGEVKRTSPSTQAVHWYSQAVLAAMRLRGKEPQWRSVIALPDFSRYRDLHADTAGSLEAAQIEVW